MLGVSESVYSHRGPGGLGGQGLRMLEMMKELDLVWCVKESWGLVGCLEWPFERSSKLRVDCAPVLVIFLLEQYRLGKLGDAFLDQFTRLNPDETRAAI